MAKYLRMIIVLSLITLVSGFALGALNEMTAEVAANNILRFKKIPAVTTIYKAVEEGSLTMERRRELEAELLAEKQMIDIGENQSVLAFVIKKNGEPYAVALEKFGQGYGGDLGVMTGFELETGRLVGIGITTMAETPGVGTRVTEPAFTEKFQNMPRDVVLKVKKDGGDIDAIAGATISSRAVAFAVREARQFYDKHQEKIRKAISP